MVGVRMGRSSLDGSTPGYIYLSQPLEKFRGIEQVLISNVHCVQKYTGSGTLSSISFEKLYDVVIAVDCSFVSSSIRNFGAVNSLPMPPG